MACPSGGADDVSIGVRRMDLIRSRRKPNNQTGVPVMYRIFLVALMATFAAGSSAYAQKPEEILAGAFSGAVRTQLRAELAQVGRVENQDGWDNKERVWTGKTKVVFEGIHSRVEKIYDTVNHGKWKKGWVELDAGTFDVEFKNFKKTQGKMEVRFQVVASGEFRGQIEYRHYDRGVKLVSLTANGRAKATAYIDLRVTLSDDGKRVTWETTAVDFKYSDVVMDKVGHFGGETAKLLGDAFTGAVKQWFPEKERDAVKEVKQAINAALKGSVEVRNDIAELVRKLK
jgi:hypothetical protein